MPLNLPSLSRKSVMNNCIRDLVQKRSNFSIMQLSNSLPNQLMEGGAEDSTYMYMHYVVATQKSQFLIY